VKKQTIYFIFNYEAEFVRNNENYLIYAFQNCVPTSAIIQQEKFFSVALNLSE